MATTPGESRVVPTLSAEQLAEIIPLIKSSGSVELKLSVPDSDRRSVIKALGLDVLEAQIRQVAFFDTPDLVLNEHGVVVRARRIQGKPGDSTVKLRPVIADSLPATVRTSPNFGIEVDAMPGGFVCSGAMKAEVPAASVKAAFDGSHPVRKLFTKEQRDLFAAHAPFGLQLGGLSMLGPINVLKLRINPPELGRKLVAEQWNYPDGSRILELSTKCTPAEAFGVAAETKVFLASHGVDLAAEQATKTKKALEYFASELQAAAAEG